MEEVGFDSAFTFVYSPRAGTEAAELDDQVPEDVKRDRMERLVDVVQRVAAARNAARVGCVEEVLVEGPSRTEPSLLRGRTRRNTTVNFSGSAAPGDLVAVEILGATSTTLKGARRRSSLPDGAHRPLGVRRGRREVTRGAVERPAQIRHRSVTDTSRLPR